MADFEWTTKYTVNVAELDRQHSTLIDMINDCEKNSENRDKLAEIMLRLVMYTENHFTLEEEYMEKAGYPDLEEHRKEHLAFTSKIREFEKEFNAGNTDVTKELPGLLISWFIDHILHVDQKYSQSLNKAGIK